MATSINHVAAALLLSALLWGCTPKNSPPEVLGSGQTIAVATALMSLDDPTQIEAPKRLADAIEADLRERTLTSAPTGALPFEFADAYSTQVRIERLAEVATSDLLMLVEAKPLFDSQIAGRFRWNVAVTVTFATRLDLDNTRSYQWDIPVFLQFYHQQEAEALAEATPMLQRHLKSALDEFLTGL